MDDSDVILTLSARVSAQAPRFQSCRNDHSLRERSCVYWKPKGAAAKRASPRAIQPQSCPLMFWGRCLLVDFEGIWGRCWYAVCHILSDTVNTEARVAGVIARLLCAHDDARTHTQTLTHTHRNVRCAHNNRAITPATLAPVFTVSLRIWQTTYQHLPPYSLKVHH